MKYEVKMSCGHTETIQLFGKCADRERYGLCEEWYDWFFSQTKASYWIDIRDDTIREIVKNWYETVYTKKEA